MSSVLKKRKDLARVDLEKAKSLMDAAVEDCLVSNYQDLIPSLPLPDPKDQHVLAAAIRGRANVIVTFNGKDFPEATLHTYGMHSRHPDDFILDLFALAEELCMDAVQEDIQHYKDPPLTLEDYLKDLEAAGIPNTAAYLRERKIIFE